MEIFIINIYFIPICLVFNYNDFQFKKKEKNSNRFLFVLISSIKQAEIRKNKMKIYNICLFYSLFSHFFSIASIKFEKSRLFTLNCLLLTTAPIQVASTAASVALVFYKYEMLVIVVYISYISSYPNNQPTIVSNVS